MAKKMRNCDLVRYRDATEAYATRSTKSNGKEHSINPPLRRSGGVVRHNGDVRVRIQFGKYKECGAVVFDCSAADAFRDFRIQPINRRQTTLHEIIRFRRSTLGLRNRLGAANKSQDEDFEERSSYFRVPNSFTS